MVLIRCRVSPGSCWQFVVLNTFSSTLLSEYAHCQSLERVRNECRLRHPVGAGSEPAPTETVYPGNGTGGLIIGLQCVLGESFNRQSY